jgi:CheY-like chemotaxis protein
MQSHSSGPSSPLGVLVVDDELIVLNFLTHGLRFQGYSVFPAASGQEAVQVLQANSEAITIALVDVNMPHLDGWATLRALWQIKPALRCCILSGGDPAELEPLVRLGTVCALNKPFSLGGLTECVRLLHGQPLPRGPLPV